MSGVENAAPRHDGTRSSNPVRSTEESVANLTPWSRLAYPTVATVSMLKKNASAKPGMSAFRQHNLRGIHSVSSRLPVSGAASLPPSTERRGAGPRHIRTHRNGRVIDLRQRRHGQLQKGNVSQVIARIATGAAAGLTLW
jgi:hypothetical protein